MKKAVGGRKYEGWFDKGSCTLPFKVDCWRRQDCCWVEVNLATLTYWGCNQILNIGVSLSSEPNTHVFLIHTHAHTFDNLPAAP